tara:strand:+ start:645 stop:1574 length:930 start_codon:yes stop_codon:yes gene_type:complete
MVEVSASQVKELRERTGAGMMDCKRALTDSGGDFDSAVESLRSKGLAAAAKKGSRVASDGLVGMLLDGNKGVLVEVNSETDFVARNSEFQKFVEVLTSTAMSEHGDMEMIRAATFPGSDHSVEAELNHKIATLGEKLDFRRASYLSISPGIVAGYVHAQATPGLGRIGVLVSLRSETVSESLRDFGHNLAMHIAASNPLSVTVEEVPSEVLDVERRVFGEQARELGKPDDVIEKIVEGRVRKFLEESVLLQQPYVMDPERSVASIIASLSSELGSEIEVAGFTRYSRGEGIEQKSEDDSTPETPGNPES